MVGVFVSMQMDGWQLTAIFKMAWSVATTLSGMTRELLRSSRTSNK